MKTIFSVCISCFMTIMVLSQEPIVNVIINGQTDGDSSLNDSIEFVDLGLPSGTLWGKVNESGYYTCFQAIYKYRTKLPTFSQFNELFEECEVEWMDNGGHRLIGPNGNFIIFPAMGVLDCDGEIKDYGDIVPLCSYWCLSPNKDSIMSYSLDYDSNEMMDYYDESCIGLPIRLVR